MCAVIDKGHKPKSIHCARGDYLQAQTHRARGARNATARTFTTFATIWMTKATACSSEAQNDADLFRARSMTWTAGFGMTSSATPASRDYIGELRTL